MPITSPKKVFIASNCVVRTPNQVSPLTCIPSALRSFLCSYPQDTPILLKHARSISHFSSSEPAEEPYQSSSSSHLYSKRWKTTSHTSGRLVGISEAHGD